MTIEARRVQRGVSGALLTLALVLLATVSVAQADTIYPTNQLSGTSFDSDAANPFADAGGSCTLLANLLPITIPEVVCDVTNDRNGTDGAGLPDAPPGSIQSEYRSVVDGLAVLPPLTLLQGKGTFRSQSFTVGASGPATLMFDRRAIIDAVIAIGGEGSYTFDLVNNGGGAPTPLVSETLTRNVLIKQSDTGWQTLAASAPVQVVANQTYHLEIHTLFQDQVVVGAQSSFTFRFDNVRFRVADGTLGFVSAPTVFTGQADEIGSTDATLHGQVRPNGLYTTYRFNYGTPLTGLTSTTPAGAVGTQLTLQDISRRITGLDPCTLYFFRIGASNSVGTSLGALKPFNTDCTPTVETLDASSVVSSSAQLNSKINPGGLDTVYAYEYRVKGTTAFTPTTTGTLLEDAGSTEPNGKPLTGLAKLTTYEYRVVANNALGTSFGLLKEFTTTDNGPAGLNGTNGTNGNPGAPGTNGINGLPGARGPAGAQGTTGSSLPDADSSSARAMIRIDAQRIVVPTKGRNIGRVRVQIFCRRIAVRTCSGTMKVRSLNPIAPQSFGFPVKPKRRVTFSTSPVQLDVGKIGFAIFDFNVQRRSVLKRERLVRSTVIVTVIDANNNRQNVRKVVTVAYGS